MNQMDVKRKRYAIVSNIIFIINIIDIVFLKNNFVYPLFIFYLLFFQNLVCFLYFSTEILSYPQSYPQKFTFLIIYNTNIYYTF